MKANPEKCHVLMSTKKCNIGKQDTQNSDYEKLLGIKINSGNQI